MLKNSVISAPIIRNGPNGTIPFLSSDVAKSANTKPVNEAMPSDKTNCVKLNVEPMKSISFISPSPSDSFLNTTLPNNFIKYIIIKAIIPFNNVILIPGMPRK